MPSSPTHSLTHTGLNQTLDTSMYGLILPNKSPLSHIDGPAVVTWWHYNVDKSLFQVDVSADVDMPHIFQ